MALVLAAAVALVSPLLWGLRTPEPVTAYLCDLLWGQTYTVFFPVFPWLAYALVGFALSDAYRRFTDRPRRFHAWVGGGGAAALAAGLLMGQLFPSSWHGVDFYRTGPAGIFALSGMSAILFFVFRAIAPRFPQAMLRGVAFFSRHVTALYCISWVAIYWNLGWLGFLRYQEWWQLLLLVVYIFSLTLTAHWAWLCFKRWYRLRKLNSSGTLVAG